MDIKAQLKQIQDKGLYREFQPIQSVEKQYIYINDQSYINLLRTIISVWDKLNINLKIS